MNSAMTSRCFKKEFYEIKLIVQIRFKISGRKRPLHTLLSFFIERGNFFNRVIRTAISFCKSRLICNTNKNIILISF